MGQGRGYGHGGGVAVLITSRYTMDACNLATADQLGHSCGHRVLRVHGKATPTARWSCPRRSPGGWTVSRRPRRPGHRPGTRVARPAWQQPAPSVPNLAWALWSFARVRVADQVDLPQALAAFLWQRPSTKTWLSGCLRRLQEDFVAPVRRSHGARLARPYR